MTYNLTSIKMSEVQNKVDKSIMQFIKEDGILLKIDCSERSITHKLAEHLQIEFVEWNVDCEYNRKNHDFLENNPKRLEEFISDCNEDKEPDSEGALVYPDIIIHQRLTEENLLVIELKKTTNNDNGNCDKKKLVKFIEKLNYQYGLFINFKTGLKIGISDLKWFSNEKLSGCNE